MNLKENIERINELILNEQSIDWDDSIDVISAVIDGVPGLGNIFSAAIDLSHTISYLMRFYSADSDEEKIEYATLSFITLLGTFIPVGGNSLPIMARQGLKRVFSKTPDEILLIAKKLGLYNKAIFLLKKTKWKYSLLLVLAKILGSELSEQLTIVSDKLYKLYQKLLDNNLLKFARAVKSFYDLLIELRDDSSIALELSKDPQL